MSLIHFTMTEQHLKLLRHANVGWEYAETGAPCIDPKRPYGNSDVSGDVARILGLPCEPEDDDSHQALLALHRETEKALQIILATGSFVPGEYVCRPYSRDWKLSSKGH